MIKKLNIAKCLNLICLMFYDTPYTILKSVSEKIKLHLSLAKLFKSLICFRTTEIGKNKEWIRNAKKHSCLGNPKPTVFLWFIKRLHLVTEIRNRLGIDLPIPNFLRVFSKKVFIPIPFLPYSYTIPNSFLIGYSNELYRFTSKIRNGFNIFDVSFVWRGGF